MDRLEDTQSSTIIRKLKSHSARCGIPSTLVSDNAPNLTLSNFTKFLKEWDINHVPSYPHFPQSNGMAESAAKTAKHILRKSREAREDQFLAILYNRNTPSQGLDESPAQRLLNRITRTLLHTTARLLEPRAKDLKQEHRNLRQRQNIQMHYHDN